MTSKLVVLVACLWSVASAQFEPSATGGNEPQQPRCFIRAELLFAGPALSIAEGDHRHGATLARFLHAGFQYKRVRLGLAFLDYNPKTNFSVLPVTAGYTIYERPISSADRLYFGVPEVYVEATVGFMNTSAGIDLAAPEIPFRGSLELVCSVDVLIGASVAAGCYYYYYDQSPWNNEPNKLGFYAAARLHLLRLRFGL